MQQKVLQAVVQVGLTQTILEDTQWVAVVEKELMVLLAVEADQEELQAVEVLVVEEQVMEIMLELQELTHSQILDQAAVVVVETLVDLESALLHITLSLAKK
jgi:hypothetical protein